MTVLKGKGTAVILLNWPLPNAADHPQNSATEPNTQVVLLKKNQQHTSLALYLSGMSPLWCLSTQMSQDPWHACAGTKPKYSGVNFSELASQPRLSAVPDRGRQQVWEPGPLCEIR